KTLRPVLSIAYCPDCLQYIFQILSSNDCHYFNRIIGYPVINTVRTTNTSAIPLLYETYRFEGIRALCYKIKIFEKSIKIFVGLGHSKWFDPVAVNTD